MKRMMLVALVASLVILVSGTTFALNSPAVSQGHGVVTGMFVGSDLSLGFEYGLTSEIAVIGNFGHQTRFGAKYELRSNLAVVGGMDQGGAPFITLNGSRGIDRNLLGMGELGVRMSGSKFIPVYELGVAYKLDRNFDIRGGLIGENLDFPRLQIGVGYGF